MKKLFNNMLLNMALFIIKCCVKNTRLVKHFKDEISSLNINNDHRKIICDHLLDVINILSLRESIVKCAVDTGLLGDILHYKQLSPLTFNENEFTCIDDDKTVLQNKRNNSVFKNDECIYDTGVFRYRIKAQYNDIDNTVDYIDDDSILSDSLIIYDRDNERYFSTHSAKIIDRRDYYENEPFILNAVEVYDPYDSDKPKHKSIYHIAILQDVPDEFFEKYVFNRDTNEETLLEVIDCRIKDYGRIVDHILHPSPTSIKENK